MRISDWSSDVCSSDLADPRALPVDGDPPLPDQPVGLAPRAEAGVADVLVESHPDRGMAGGRAVWQIGPATARAEPAPLLLSGSLTKRLDISGLLCKPIFDPPRAIQRKNVVVEKGG